MIASFSTVELIPLDVARDLPRLRVWLERPHVTRWWGDRDEAMAAIRQHSPTDHALIAVDARPVGYLCWQRPLPEELAAAGLSDLPADLIDVDILIGEPDSVGRGIGPQALTLLLDRLRAAGQTSVGIAAAAANPRARRAYEKAGFRLFRAFQEAGQDYHYLVQSWQVAV
ncbi:MAG: acetyltransferase [Gemmatimonadota bacterium]|nr:acetyltransferase [Gemmatimonadota bacterium]